MTSTELIKEMLEKYEEEQNDRDRFNSQKYK